MRVLASTTANDGHAGPLLSFARACAAAGHEVVVAAPSSYAASVERAGFAHAPFGDPPPDLIGPVMARVPELGFMEADDVIIREVFGRIDAQAGLPGLTEAVAAWRPDVVIREPAELASLAAAEQAGTPHAQIAIGMQDITRRITELIGEPVAELGSLVGLPDGQLLDALEHETALSLVPEELDRAGDPGYRDDLLVARFRDISAGSVPGAGGQLPAWGDPEHPLIYVTFGSVAGSLPPFAGVFREALEALASEELRVFMTVGRRIEPASLEPLPANACVEQWWPQDDVLAQASAMLGHGGFGTTYGAYARGVPQVVAPLFSSDQAANGVHVAATGAGRTVPPGPDVVARAAAELPAVLHDPSYLAAARAGARQVADLPPVSDAVPLLERLVG